MREIGGAGADFIDPSRRAFYADTRWPARAIDRGVPGAVAPQR